VLIRNRQKTRTAGWQFSQSDYSVRLAADIKDLLVLSIAPAMPLLGRPHSLFRLSLLRCAFVCARISPIARVYFEEVNGAEL